MQRTTISSYPHLADIKPINGIVYKATNIYRPNSKITVMPLQEVQMHQKHESVAAMMEENKPQRKLLRLKNKCIESLKDTVLCSDFDTADSIFEESDSPARPIPLARQWPARKSSGEKVVHSLRKLKKTFKKVFKPKGSSTSPDGVAEGGSHVQSTPALKPGFLCSHGGCAQCTVPFPVTPPNRAPPPVPVGHTYQPPESMSSGFTSTTGSSSGSSNPISSSPTDLDVFQDFDGTYIEPTPPQIAPLRPISSFVSKLQGSPFSDIEWSLADLSKVEEDTEITVPGAGPEDPAYPTPSGSDEENWPLAKVEHIPTPSKTPVLDKTQREWSFQENMPDETIELLAHRGSAARRRRMAAA